MPKLDIPNTIELSQDLRKLVDVLNDESDLACVLIGASYLDAALVSRLKSHFIAGSTAEGLLKPGGALGDFGDRASICYCLGLIPKYLYNNLRKIAEIRNLFAHKHLMLSFSNPEVISLVGELSLPKMEPPEEELHTILTALQNPRNKFDLIVVMIANRLILDTTSDEAQRRATQD